ncbi:glutamine synthetase [Salinisphaera sp. USBA-960]|nr:glutamine synthetase [Salifodinibacter halophilus]NNC26332.1 glutamine synthetase [Salifodinibacter halophilus]
MTPEPVDKANPSTVTYALAGNEPAEFIEAFIVDINGIARGKRVPMTALDRLYEKGLCLPASTALLDIWGSEVEDTGLVLETGDADHICWPVLDKVWPQPWSQRSGGQLLMQMHANDGTPFAGDPRVVLNTVLERLNARGLHPVIAIELEFRLLEAELDSTGVPTPAKASTGLGQPSQLYGLEELERLDPVFADIQQACSAQGLPIDTLIAEQSEGQYEINLEHVDDAMQAADQALLLKRTIKACAHQHGLAASFMAKPFGMSAGNGMHVHISVLDDNQDNVFSKDSEPTECLMQSVAGLLNTMADATALFAPHANSYRRFQAGSHVPMAPSWGWDNRTTALRLPLATPAATRIEHRVAGADANPYLVLAAVLAGIEHGLDHGALPSPETHGNAYDQHAPSLPDDWSVALARFEQSAFITDYIGATYQSWFAACKRQERDQLKCEVPTSEYAAYLQTV